MASIQAVGSRLVGVVRINAIGLGAVEYLLHGCDPSPAEQVQDLENLVAEHEQALREGREHAHGAEQGHDLDRKQEVTGPSGRGQWVAKQGANYYLDAVKHGEPAGVWFGSGIAAVGLPYRAGEVAEADPLRAIFGEHRYPESVKPGSTKDSPVYLGNKPRNYPTLSERVDKALKAEPDATLERQAEIEAKVGRKKSPSSTAYYDVTFSPDKSVSVYYAALIAAGDYETAQAVREAHDLAVRLALEGAEKEVAWVRTGTHGAAGPSGETVGKFEPAVGLVGVLFAHTTNRDGEPQLHAHGGVLNKAATEDGRIFALDGNAFRPVKDAMKVRYDRTMEALMGAVAPAVFVARPEGKGRQIAGITPKLMDEASGRTRVSVQPKLDALTQEFRDNHGGREPGPRERNRIRNKAVTQTRSPKSGPAGRAGIEAWNQQGEAGRRERLTAGKQAVEDQWVRAIVGGHSMPMATGELAATLTAEELATQYPTLASVAARRVPVAAELASGRDGVAMAAVEARRAELLATVLPLALATVQRQYATWSIGNLVDAIDNQLGDDHGALQLAPGARHEWLWDAAQRAVAGGHGVVQVGVADPVVVPAELRREVDGRSELRRHRPEAYAMAEHLSGEERLRAIAISNGARRLDPEVVAGVADRARSVGLSTDQVAVLEGALSSGRRIEILVGPAGAGKSHTVRRLAEEWTALTGGQVFGTATGQKATNNLDGLGIEVINTHNLVASLTPDERGTVARRLTDRDFIVLDEAGMSLSPDQLALAEAVEAAGAKMMFAGDHHQLTSPGAGGMFAHLAALPGTLELEQVHRFQNPWEREASLRLRVGDPSVAAVYANEGRLRLGTLDEMEYQATQDFIADMLEPTKWAKDDNGNEVVVERGVESLLIVTSNEQAARLSKDIQTDLARLGLIGSEKLIEARGEVGLRRGDRVQAERNDRQLRVDGAVDADGKQREALPVTNRDIFTVLSYDPEVKELLVRDQRGAVAHLTKDYVREYVSLAYAVTNHSAQGLSVQRGRFVGGRDVDLEALYPGLTRGWEYNVGYFVGEWNADEHDPMRIRDTKEARMVEVMGRSDIDRAAITVREESIAEMSSMLKIGDTYDRWAVDRGRTRYAAMVGELLGVGAYEEKAYPALLGRLRAVELAGHDVRAVFEQAIAARELDSADSLSKVMHHRLQGFTEDRARDYTPEQVAENRRAALRPAWAELAVQHHARAAAEGSAVEDTLGRLAAMAHARTEELGAAQAVEPAPWALEWLGAVPDAEADPAGHRQWTTDAGVVAAYREYRNIPADQISIGEAPPEVQQLAYELWTRAADAGAGDPRAVNWRALSDVELRERVEVWERTQRTGPLVVSDERGEALQLAHDAHTDALVGQARLDAMADDDPAREGLAARVHDDEVMAAQARGFAQSLDDAHATRQAWWASTAPEREAAQGARRELDRRTPASQKNLDAGEEPRAGDGQSTQGGQGKQGGQEQPRSTGRQGKRGEPQRYDPREPWQKRTLFGEQETLDLDNTVDTAATPKGSDRFTDGYAAARERGLAEVDPDGTMSRREREGEFGRQVGAEVHAGIRVEHGARLDPQGQLSDSALTQARVRELATQTREQAEAAARDAAEQAASVGHAPAEHTRDEELSPGGGEIENAAVPATGGEPSQREAPAVELPSTELERPEPREGTEPTTEVGAERAVSPAEQVGQAMRELRQVERNGHVDRAVRQAAHEHDAQAAGTERVPSVEQSQNPRQALEAAEEQAALDDEVAQRRGPSLGQQHSAKREQEIEQHRHDGMEMD